MKKGFTMIELLAVIIIVAIISLVAIPVISNVVNNTKVSALKSSANGLLEASNLYRAKYGISDTIRFDIEDNKITSNDTDKLLSYNGSVKKGTVIIDKKGNVIVCVTDGKNAAYKNYNDKNIITIADESCYIPETRSIVYLENSGATRDELTNQELTDQLAEVNERLLHLERTKANQSDLDATNNNLNTTNSNLEIVSTVASSATLDKVYPVGSIYMTMTENTKDKVEAKLGGTWEQIESGRMLQSTSSTSGAKGGQTSVSYTPVGSVGNHKLTVAEIPSHEHPIANSYSGRTEHGGSNTHILTFSGYGTNYYLVAGYGGSVGGNGSHNHPFTGTATTIATMPPYITVYMYKRIA